MVDEIRKVQRTSLSSLNKLATRNKMMVIEVQESVELGLLRSSAAQPLRSRNFRIGT